MEELHVPNVISLGEALIDLFAGEGVTLREMRPLTPSPGGAPANVAVGLARLGVSVGFVGKVGDDAYGSLLIDLLSTEGVDTSHVVADPRGPTMLALVEAPSPTQQSFVLYHGADALLRPEEIDEGYICSARMLVYGSVTLTHGSGPAVLRAACLARSLGRTVVFDVNLRPSLWPDMDTARERIWEALHSATVVKLNETELEFLTGTRDPALGSEMLLRRGIPLCCVSLGADGSYFLNRRGSGAVPAFRVQVADTTGSGDAFVAGLACRLSELGVPPIELSAEQLGQVLLFANACGALAATDRGAMSALPTREMVEGLLRQR